MKNGITTWIHGWKRKGLDDRGEEAGGEPGFVDGAR